jgi:hypothetical protein
MSSDLMSSVLSAERGQGGSLTSSPPDGAVYAHSSVEAPVRPGRRTPVVMALVFLPWIAVVLFTAGGWAALNLFAYAIVVFASGYGIVAAALPRPARAQVLVLAPAVGIVAISALTAFWVRLGLPLIWAPVLWLGLTAAGALALWRDRDGWAKSTVAYGLTLALFSALICAVYFLPSARNDLVQRRDGSFHWMYVDTQQFHSIAASIKRGGGPPKTPGTVTAELLYHFGPYAPAAAISKLDGLDLGDAVARVTRGASLWALVVSCFGLGTLLSLHATGKKFGGIVSVAGVFFYGSLLSLFAAARTSSGHMVGAILFNIPDIGVIADGGPFDHLRAGHSVLHGLVAITAVMGLCLAERRRESVFNWRVVMLLLLPALVVPVNSVSALYCAGVVGILLFWGRLRETRPWLPIILMFSLFLGAWSLMGYSHSPDAAHVMFNQQVTSQWWTFAVWLMVGLGFRIVGFRWISQPLKEPLSALVLASVVGLLAISLLLVLRDGGAYYGIYFLQPLISIFAFSRVTPGCWRGVERSQMIADWLRPAKTAMILLTAGGLLIGCVAFATHHHTGITHFGPKILLSFILLSLLAGISTLMKRSRQFSTVGSAILMGILMVGFLGWAPNWVRYGLGQVKSGITYGPGEVLGLRRLGELMTPGERFATNKHDPGAESLAPPNERSYGYSALSERPVLLEGYLSRGENLLPWFKTLLHDNDLLFSTIDPETVRSIAKTWHVRWLVARPGTDIALRRPLPAWLVEQQNCGDLRIYRID